MSNVHKSKTNFLWLIITAIIFMFKETNKSCNITENIKKPEKNSFELVFISEKEDMKKIKGSNWIILADYRRRHSHINTIQYFITKANVAVLYIDNLERASIANKYGFKKPNKVYLFDRNRYIKNLKSELDEEIKKIQSVTSKAQRVNYIKHLLKRLASNKLSRFDESYHFENLDLLICFRLRLLHKIFTKFVLNKKSSILFISFLITNLVNSFIFMIK